MTIITAPEGIQEISVSHVFDADPNAVFRTWTDPALIPRWWGPARYATVVDYMEARTGGMWRFVQRDANGKQHGFRGVYHRVEAPHCIISTFEYEAAPGHVWLEAATFSALGAKTKYAGLSVFQSLADRDAIWAAGCEQGVTETIARMDALLREQSR